MIRINERWRIVESDDRPPYRQWMLQRTASPLATGENAVWSTQSFCQTRNALERAIREKIIHAAKFYPGGNSMPVDDAAMATVKTLPEKIGQSR
jgi:hypothetical protein